MKISLDPKMAKLADHEIQLPGSRITLDLTKFYNRPEKLDSKSGPAPVIIHAQNVHDYFIKHHKEHGWENLASFMAVRPPFAKLRIEYDHTFYQRDDGDTYQDLIERGGNPTKPVTRHVRVGIGQLTPKEFDYYMRPEADTTLVEEDVNRHARESLRWLTEKVNPERFVEVRLCVEDVILPGRWFVAIDATGQVLTHENYGWVYITNPQEQAEMQVNKHEYLLEPLQNAFTKHGAVALATIQFMNCRNVEVVDNPPSRQQRRDAERRQVPPPVTYKTLVIKPIMRRRIQAGHATGEGHERSLHIARGHFKSYKEGRGLGKNHVHGVWWWAPQLRGSADRGAVVKEYQVDV